MTMLIAHIGHDWVHFDDALAHELTAYPKLGEPALTVFDLGAEMVSGVVFLEGNPAHAPVLINRRLTTDGSIDGDARVLIHAVEKTSSGYMACYTAIPEAHWQKIESWSRAQPRVCVLVPLVGLMLQRARGPRALAARSGREFVFVARINRRIIHCATLAFSEEPGDLEAAVRSLGERVRQELLGVSGLPDGFSVEWHAAFSRTVAQGGDDSRESLAKLFFEQAQLPGDVAPARQYRVGESTVQTSMSTLVDARSFLAGVNPPSHLLCWAAEHWLVRWSAACGVIALASVVGAGALMLRAHGIAAQATQMQVVASQIEAQASALERDAVMPAGFDQWSHQIVAQDQTRRRFDVNRLLGVLGGAARASGVRVLRIYSAAPSGASAAPRQQRPSGARLAPDMQAVVVDAALPAGLAADHVSQLARFVELLRAKGFGATPVDTAGGKVSGNVLAQIFTYQLDPLKPSARAGDGS